MASFKGSVYAKSKANQTRSKLKGYQAKERVRQDQIEANFSALFQALGIGEKLYSRFSDNQGLIDFAEGEGFKTRSGAFHNVFGDPKFEKNGVEYDSTMIDAIRVYRNLEKQKNMLDALDDTPSDVVVDPSKVFDVLRDDNKDYGGYS